MCILMLLGMFWALQSESATWTESVLCPIWFPELAQVQQLHGLFFCIH